MRKFVLALMVWAVAGVTPVREALEEGAFPHTLHVVKNGAVAVDFLRQMGVNGGCGPDLIILDLNLPGKTGRQIMAEMETIADLRTLPVAILTTSHSEIGIGKEFPQLRSTFAAFTFGPCVSGGLLAPTATCDGRGGVLAIFHMASATPQGGADMFMTLPRRLTLIGKDELGVEPAGDIESLRGDHCSVAQLPLPANREVILDAVFGNAIELRLEIDPQDAAMIELNVLRSPGREEYTRIAFFKQRGYYHPQQWATFECDWGSLVPESLISIDSSYSSLRPDVRCRAPETAPVYLAPGEPLKLRVFLDKSVVEVFANGRQCAAVRVYPSLADSVGVCCT